MSVIDDLIYDRTQADVDRVFELKGKILAGGLSALTDAEKTEYMAGMKGAYNYTDLNRVGQAVSYIAQQMKTLPQRVAAYSAARGGGNDVTVVLPYDPESITVSPKTDWAVTDIPMQAAMETYLANLTELREQLTLPADAPTVPTSMRNLTFSTTNDIEYLLYLINTALVELEQSLYDEIDKTVAAFEYVNLYYCGE